MTRLAPRKPYRQARREWLAEYLSHQIACANGVIAEAARLSGLNRQSFYKAMRSAGLEPGLHRAPLPPLSSLPLTRGPLMGRVVS